MEPIQVLTWVIICVFALTAIITLGGLVESFDAIRVKDEYLHKLFTVLILEIVAVCIPLGADAIKDSRCNDECMLERIKSLDASSPLAKNILELRNTFQGIFETPEYNIEISFGELDSLKAAKACPQGPFYMSNVMVFRKDRKGGTIVVPLSPAQHLCTDDGTYKIEISKQWASKGFGLTESTENIQGWGKVIPPSPTL